MPTFIREKVNIKLQSPILIEGLPGLGYVGKIAVKYLVRELKAKLLADLYSSYFPPYVIVNSKRKVRLLKYRFYYWQNNSGNDLVLLTGDVQAQNIEGQYEIANKIVDYAKKIGVRTVITIGGYSVAYKDKAEVIAVTNDEDLLKKLVEAGSKLTKTGIPIVGAAGLLVCIAKMRGLKSACLLGETVGYMPDLRSAKSVLLVLNKLLNLNLDFSRLDEEIEKIDKTFSRVKEVERKLSDYEKLLLKAERDKMTYIS